MASRWRWQLVQAGRLIEKKGFATSLRAFAEFAARYPQATLTIAGEGPLQQPTGIAGARLGIDGQGFLPRFHFAKAAARAVLFVAHFSPSERDGRGWKSGRRSELDAGSDGQRTSGFCHDHGGIPEAIENDAAGYWLRNDDHLALAEKLLEFVQSGERLSELAQRGAEVGAEKFR